MVIGRVAAATAFCVLAVCSSPVRAGDEIDLDHWHAELLEAIGEEPADIRTGQWSIGIYPTLGGVLGPPNWIAYEGAFSLSLSNGQRLNMLLGCGFEGGPNGEAYSVTFGWGGVRPIPSAAPQLGFHSKYLRYKRWDHRDQGVHHGLSVGTEHGIGHYAVSLELGAALSERDHWLIIAEFSLKLALPVRIPLTENRSE